MKSTVAAVFGVLILAGLLCAAQYVEQPIVAYALAAVVAPFAAVATIFALGNFLRGDRRPPGG